MKILLIFSAIIFLFSVDSSAENELLTISTYYPSPYGSYNELEVKGRLALGDPSADPKVGSISNLDIGQLYIGDSIILKSLTSDPPSGNKAGQIIYNGPDKMVKFWDGSKWVPVITPCSSGIPCSALPAVIDIPGTSCPSTCGYKLISTHYSSPTCNSACVLHWPNCGAPVCGGQSSSCTVTGAGWGTPGTPCSYNDFSEDSNNCFVSPIPRVCTSSPDMVRCQK